MDGDKMQRCTLGWFARIVTALVFLGFFIPLTGLALYFVFSPQSSPDERLMFGAGAAVFGGLSVFAVYRFCYYGLPWIEYDDVRVVFHYSRRGQLEARWADIPGPAVQVSSEDGGYLFRFQDGGKQRKILVNHLSSGFKEMERMLKETGVLKRIGRFTKEDFRQSAEEVLRQFERYRAANPNAVRPRPAEDCSLCPDCEGRGAYVRRLPFIKLDVAKICKTCGGSGYIPK